MVFYSLNARNGIDREPGESWESTVDQPYEAGDRVARDYSPVQTSSLVCTAPLKLLINRILVGCNSYPYTYIVQ
jgi:hypothetical protein